MINSKRAFITALLSLSLIMGLSFPVFADDPGQIRDALVNQNLMSTGNNGMVCEFTQDGQFHAWKSNGGNAGQYRQSTPQFSGRYTIEQNGTNSVLVITGAGEANGRYPISRNGQRFTIGNPQNNGGGQQQGARQGQGQQQGGGNSGFFQGQLNPQGR